MTVERQTIAVFCCCGHHEPAPDNLHGELNEQTMMWGDGLYGHDYQYLGRCPAYNDGCDEKHPLADKAFRILIRK